MLLSVCSCSPGFGEVGKEGDASMVLTIYNTAMSSKAEGDPVKKPGEAFERLVDKLDIFFYVAGSTSGVDLYIQRTSIGNDNGRIDLPIYISNELEKLVR